MKFPGAKRRMRSHFGKGGAVATKERRALAIEEVFELRDYQIRTDCAHERAEVLIAQRYAVPTLNDLVGVASSEEVEAEYGGVMAEGNRPLIKAFSRHYRVDFSKTTQSSYWMNHCEHCGMKQGDFEMYCEPQGAFFPMDERAASQIVLHEFAEPFGCNGSTAYGDHLFEYMRRA